MKIKLPLLEPDDEWHVRHNPEMRVQAAKTRRAIGIVLLVLLTLVVGMVGGITGFVTLANSDSAWTRDLQRLFNLDNISELRVPVKQNLQLEESSAVIDAAKKISPAVVSVTASGRVMDFFGQVSDQDLGGGTGFIITSDGLIITNKHVVEQQASYKVVLNDGKIYDATIKAVDPYNDLAVLKIDAKDLPTVELGSSADLQVGQYVIAVGNALAEFQNSVSLGVVSAKGRTLSNIEGTSETLTDLIQTDAAINPGNSGGPLVNLAGQVVGINSVIASNTGGSIGLGFAISIDSVKSIIDSVRKTGQIIRPYLGVRYLAINKTIKQLNSLSVDYGVIVTSGNTLGALAVIPGGPSDKAGIKENDILLKLNGDQIDQDHTLPFLLSKYQVGEKVSVQLLRSGSEMTVQVTLEAMPVSE